MITTKEQLKNTKIRVHSPKESKRIQKRAFELGWIWPNYDGITYIQKPYLYFDNFGDIYYGSTSEIFEKHKYKEITLADLFEDNDTPNKSTL